MRNPFGFIVVPSLSYFRFGVIVCLLLISGIAVSSVPASADDFVFSFTNTTGTVSGTVSGEIFGLTNNSTSAATELIITSAPTSLGLGGATPIIATQWNEQIQDTFTEFGGFITSLDFAAEDTVTGDHLVMSSSGGSL